MGRPKGSKNKIVVEKMNAALRTVFNEARSIPVMLDKLGALVQVKRGRGRPKGSLNKIKTSPRNATVAPEMTKVKEPDGCYVCGRVSWGPVQPLGLGQWRHAECYPGSPTWIQNYPTFDPSKISEAGELLFVGCRQQ